MNDNARSGHAAHVSSGCLLCESAGGHPVWADAAWRAVRVDDDAFPAFYRLISQTHVCEFSDLSSTARHRSMSLIATMERTLIESLHPTKMNLASFGNLVPHLHWHVVARFEWDSRWPDPLWATPRREVDPPAARRLAIRLESLDEHVAHALSAKILP